MTDKKQFLPWVITDEVQPKLDDKTSQSEPGTKKAMRLKHNDDTR